MQLNKKESNFLTKKKSTYASSSSAKLPRSSKRLIRVQLISWLSQDDDDDDDDDLFR